VRTDRAIADQAISKTNPANDGWEIVVKPYGWMSGQSGVIGFAGFEADYEVDFADILENLDGGALLGLDIWKGRWGFVVDGVSLSMGFI
jgi:hypothetical protein